MMRMKVLGVPMVALVASAIICAAHGKTVSLAPLGGRGASATADDTVKVQGRGVGATKEEALKDAYRDAIERAIGLYADAETIADNDQLIKNQVLTHSNAYITDYRELGEEKLGGGLIRLRILATVKKGALTTKLSGVMPAQTVKIDNTGLQNVHAQLVTKEKRAEDAAALLKNALDGINPMQSLMVANIRPETQKIITADAVSGRSIGRGGRGRSTNVGNSAADTVTLRYLFEVKLDREKYFKEFVPNLKKVLEQISLTKPREIRLTELMPASDEYQQKKRAEALQKYILGGYVSDDLNWRSDTNNADAFSGIDNYKSSFEFNAFFDPLHVYSILWKGDNWVWQFDNRLEFRPRAAGSFSWKNIKLNSHHYKGNWGDFDSNYRKDKVYFAMITSLKADCSNGKVTIYELDKSVIDVLNNWNGRLMSKKDGRDDIVMKSTNYNIVLLDKAGEEIGVYPWQIPNGLLINIRFAELPGAGMVYCTPFVGCFGECLIQWRDFVVEKDALAKIASVKIELEDVDQEPASATPVGGYTK